jgi:AcrR family transcriptional regulator
MSTATVSHDTSARLLAAAIEVFVEVGYRNATLRGICQRAGTNNAAVNYHFRDKEHLYLAVIDHAVEQMQRHVPRVAPDPAVSPEERLRRFVHALLTGMLGQGPPTWLMKIMANELAEPTAGLELVVQKVIAPMNANAVEIVRELTGPAATAQQVQDCASSIMGQCANYHHGRAVIARLGIYPVYDEATIDHLTGHIVRFSLAGIRAMVNPVGLTGGN